MAARSFCSSVDETARRDVLGRLLELNHQRYAEEIAARLHNGRARIKISTQCAVTLRSEMRAEKTGNQLGLL
jgi:hypothetical protein